MRHEKIGETLRQEGFISQKELDSGLEKQSELKRKKLGDILLEKGRIKVDEIKEALKLQKTNFDCSIEHIFLFPLEVGVFRRNNTYYSFVIVSIKSSC